MDPKKSGIVSLENLPETDWVYFNKRQLIKDLLDFIIQSKFNKVKNKCKTLSELTGLSLHFISKLYVSNRNKIKIAHLKLLLSFLPMKQRKNFLAVFERLIISIGYQKSIHKPILPINFSSREGLKFLADLFTDGSLNSNFQVTYANSNIDFILDNINSVNLLLTNRQLKLGSKDYDKIKKMNPYEIETHIKRIIFKKSLLRMQLYAKEKIYRGKKTFVYQVYYPNFLGKILYYSLGIQKGKRVYTNPKLPLFVFRNKNLLSFFVARIFSNEGHVSSYGCGITHSIDVTHQIKYMGPTEQKEFLSYNRTTLAPNLLWDYKKIFYILGCKKPSDPYVANLYLTTKQEVHAKWQIYIGGIDVVTLLNNVDFDIVFRKRLEKYINSVHIFRQSKEMRIDQILKFGRSIQSNKGYFTTNDVCKRVKLEKSSIKKNLKIARERGWISISSYNGNAYCYVVEA